MNANTIKRALLIDDHALFRSSLAMLLEHSLGINAVKTLGTLKGVKAELERFMPDVILLDYHMPNGDALAVGQAIKQRHPSIKLLYLTGTQSGAALNQLVDSNADGVLHKQITPPELAEALARVTAGERVISEHITSKLPLEKSRFTEREFQLFRLLIQGETSKEVAERLHISPRTAEKHRENLLKKTGAQNIAQLIELGYKWQILDIEAGA
ncbi:MAG TPA: response regulator transcription factor [Marinagarivorans sp.]